MSDFNDILRMQMSNLQNTYARRYGQQYGDPTQKYTPTYAQTLEPYPGIGGGREGIMRAEQRQSMFNTAPATNAGYGFQPPVQAQQLAHTGIGPRAFDPSFTDQTADGRLPQLQTPQAAPLQAGNAALPPSYPADPTNGAGRRRVGGINQAY